MKTKGAIDGVALVLAALLAACLPAPARENAAPASETKPAAIKVYSLEAGGLVDSETVVKTEAEWKAALAPERYNVLREEGTEIAFSSTLHSNHAAGVYSCAACGLELFTSETKFDSGTGWPSFWGPLAAENVAERAGRASGIFGTEIECARCGSHLGHVFNDGPQPTGLRYCMNGLALTFETRDLPAAKGPAR